MPLIAQNHFQFILEIGAIIFALVTFTLNLVPISLSIITFLSLFLSVGFTFLFGADLLMLVLSFGQNEFLILNADGFIGTGKRIALFSGITGVVNTQASINPHIIQLRHTAPPNLLSLRPHSLHIGKRL